MGAAGFESLDARGLVAQNDETDVVAVRIESEVIQSQHIVRPTAAADTLNRNQFALKILGSLEFRSGQEIPIGVLEQRPDDHDSQPSGGEIQHGVGAG